MHFDVIIVGGGLAGLSLAVALRHAPLTVALVERAPPSPAPADASWDARIYAISPANQRFLQQIGIWPRLEHARITSVATMEIFGDAGGRLDFAASDVGVSELAWILESSLLAHELWQTLERQDNVTLLCPAQPESLRIDEKLVSLELADGRRQDAQLIVAADGANSWTRRAAGVEVRTTPYGEKGVVANFACELEHHHCARQWFREDGALAWLPLPDKRLSMVWSTPNAHADALVRLDAASLCERVAAAGHWRLGALSLLTPPRAFPLQLMRAPRFIGPRLALIGDAAHCLHPLAGYGINLGLQDASVLADLITARPEGLNYGDERWLRHYERARQGQVLVLQSATHALQRLFRPRHAGLSLLRNTGLNLVNAASPLRQLLVRYALG